MRNMTYRNLLTLIRKIQTKGYDFEESERLARSVFVEFQTAPQGMSIEERVRRIVTKEEWKREYG